MGRASTSRKNGSAARRKGKTSGRVLESDRLAWDRRDLHELVAEPLLDWERRHRGELTKDDKIALSVARAAMAYLGGSAYLDEGEWTRDRRTRQALVQAWLVMRGRDRNKPPPADAEETRIRHLAIAVERWLEYRDGRAPGVSGALGWPYSDAWCSASSTISPA